MIRSRSQRIGPAQGAQGGQVHERGIVDFTTRAPSEWQFVVLVREMIYGFAIYTDLIFDTMILFYSGLS